MAPKQSDPQFKLRMTPEIKEAVERAAAENNRSMNAEILARLQKSISGSIYSPDHDETIKILLAEQKRLINIAEDAENKANEWRERLLEISALNERIKAQMNAVCWNVISYRQEAPKQLITFAKTMLEVSNKGSEFSESQYIFDGIEEDES